MKKWLVIGGLIALGAFGGGPVVGGIEHAVSGPTCTLRWIGSNAYITMNGPDAPDACRAEMGLTSNVALVDHAPNLPTVCRHPLYGTTTMTVRASDDDVTGTQLCNGR